MKKWILKNKLEKFKTILFSHEETTYEMNNGKFAKFDVLKCPDWVNVVAITSSNEFIVIKQFRVGIDEFTIEFPAGGLEAGEDPLEGAKRELIEETGYSSSEWEKIGFTHPNPAIMNNYCYFYLAKNCKKVSSQNLDPLEEIEVMLINEQKLVQFLKDGTISHALVVACYGLYKLNF